MKRGEARRKILGKYLEDPSPKTQTYFVDEFGISKSTVSDNFRTLIEDGILKPWGSKVALHTWTDLDHATEEVLKKYKEPISQPKEHPLILPPKRGPPFIKNLVAEVMNRLRYAGRSRKKEEVEAHVRTRAREMRINFLEKQDISH